MVQRIPGGGRRCASPRLGVLCGADAVGAIVGIALGGTIVLCLALMAFLYSRRGRVGGAGRGVLGLAQCSGAAMAY